MLTDFYQGKITDADGMSLDDFLAADDDTINAAREFVPWVFPSDKEAKAYPNGPVLAQDEADKFRQDQALRAKVKEAVNRFVKYLHNTDDWRNTVSHHHVRVSRMIRFLKMIGMAEEAKKVSEWCIKYSDASKRTKAAWYEALEHRPSWEVAAEEKAKADQEALRQSAISKMTPEERKAFGIEDA